MRRTLALIALCHLGACFMARQDARIRPGGQVGVTSVVMYTPDAITQNPDAPLRGIPDENDASNVRGLTELAFVPGRHAVTWDGRDDAGRRVSLGVYFVRFVADGVVNTGKALLLP